jgi:autotransporter translocation and assembly factor TamB
VAETVLRDVKLAGVYQWSTDHLRVDHLAAGAFDGQLTATGELLNLLSGAPFLRLEAEAERVNLAELPLDLLGIEDRSLTGHAGLQLSLDGPLTALSGEAELKVNTGSIDRFSYDQFQLLLSGDRNQLMVRGTLREKEGMVIASGLVYPSTGRYEGELFLRGLILDDQLLPQTLPAVSGSVNGLLAVKGHFKDKNQIQGQGWLEVYDLLHNGQELGILKLKGQADQGRLHFADSFLLTPVGQIQLTGSVNWQDKPFYDFIASGENLLCEDILALFPDFAPVTMEGLTTVRLRATGWEKPLLAAEVTMAGIALNGYYLEDGKMALRWEDGELCLDHLQIGSASMQLQANGEIGPDQELDLAVAAKDFPLTALEPLLGRYLDNQGVLGKIAGNLTGEGRLAGTFQEPIFEGNLNVTQPVIAGFAVDRIIGDLVWKDRQLFLDEMVVSRGQEELTVYGRVDWTGTTPDLDFGLKMDGAGLADLLLLAGRVPNFHLDGEISGYLRIFGALDQPRIRLMAQIKNGEINDFASLNGELDLQIYDTKVTINRLLLDDGEGELFASAVYTPGTQVEITAETKDFPLEPLVALTGRTNLPTAGRFDLELALTTTSGVMQGEFEALLKDTAWGNINVASLGLSGQITDDLVFIEAEDLGANRLSMEGYLPLNPMWFGLLQLPTAWPHRFSQIDLGISAEKMEASALNTFFKEPEITRGTIDGLISLNGTWQNPYLVGLLEITGGRGKITGLPSEVRDVNGLLSISPQGLEFRGLNNKEGSSLEGRLGKGRFRLGGRVIMDGLRLEAFALRLKGDNLYLTPFFFDGLVSGQLALTGPVAKPMLQGKVTLRKARIELPEGGGRPLPFDLDLDLACQAANDVYFRIYGMAYVPFNGDIHVGGSLGKPELDGVLTSTRGWVNVLGDTFRIKNLKAEFRPDYKLYPYLEMEATRNLAGTEVTISTAGWSGELESMVINPSSNPPKSREEILKLLSWPEKIEDGTLTFATVFRENINMVGDFFIGRVLDEFRSVMPIDFLTLEKNRTEGTFWMNMGKSLSEDLYLSYSRSLTPLTEQVWNLEWRIVPNFSVLGDYSAEEGLSWQFKYNLRF